ncbi:Crc1 [Kluyveromyces lactis]|nr:Crc1 [Kluyveromyces lactis]
MSDASIEIELETSHVNDVSQTKSQLTENLKSLAAGGVGGVCAVLTGHPFDLVKVRCQSNQARSAMDAVSHILQAARQAAGPTSLNAVRGFYKGVVPPLLGVTPIFAVSFWGYDVGKKLVTRVPSSAASGVAAVEPELTLSQMAAAGFISAIPTTLVTAPTERVKVVLQTTQGKSSFLDAAKQIVRTQGFQSLFKGSLATLSRDGPGSALYFASYEICKEYLNKASGHTSGELSITNVCISGGMAGVSMWVVVFPIDTVKTQLQSSSKRQSMLEVTRMIYNTRGGIKGFFPGVGPAILRSFPANAATFLGVELTHSLFKKFEQQKTSSI